MPGKITRVPEVIWRKIDNNVVIIKEDGTKLITLNSTAAYIWEKCNGEMDARAIAAKLMENFEASYEEIYDDVLKALKSLDDMGLIKMEGDQ